MPTRDAHPHMDPSRPPPRLKILALGQKETMSRGTFKLVKCMNCRAIKKLLKEGGNVTPLTITAFEADGWLYRSGSRGVCPDCNIFHKMEKHHGPV